MSARRRRITALPPLAPAAGLRPARHTPFPLGERRTSIHAWGRHALWHGLKPLLSAGDEILAPAWHHGSEIEVLSKLGVTCRFYDCPPDLEPDPAELESLLGSSTRALHLTHYLGFPREAERWRAWADERDLLLIEDAAQAWLASHRGRPVGSFGDVAIFCLYKTFGLPDGAACVRGGSGPAPPPPRKRRAASLVARRRLAWVAQRLPLASVSAPAADGYSSEFDFALGDPDLPTAAGALRLVPRIADASAAERRRSNYTRLLESLGDRVAQGFEQVDAGSSPFAFPLRVEDKGRALAYLHERGVLALDFWSEPHRLLDADRFPDARRRRSETVALPVHQELRDGDLDRVAALAGEAAAG